MMPLVFRNLTVSPSDPVAWWGTEGVLTAIERGNAQDWGKILHALDADTSGVVRRFVTEAVECADPDLGATHLIRDYLSQLS